MNISAAAHVDRSPQARDGPERGGAEQVLRRLQEDELCQHRLGVHIQIHCQVGRNVFMNNNITCNNSILNSTL